MDFNRAALIIYWIEISLNYAQNVVLYRNMSPIWAPNL